LDAEAEWYVPDDDVDVESVDSTETKDAVSETEAVLRKRR
jgi:hypothetical protein